MTRCTLFAVLLTGLLAVPTVSGCGDDGGNDSDTTTDTLGGDTNVPTDTTADTTADTTVADTNENTDTESDTATNPCGSRECGEVNGVSCGSCGADETCDAAGKCVSGDPMGSYCGVTDTCNADANDWPDCINAQCRSQICLSESGVIFTNKSVCTKGCLIYKDDDEDGVNDDDAPLDDCNPEDIVSGPAGDVFRCVNTADIGQSPNGVCLPGTEFNTCTSDADCASGEGCDLVSTAAGVAFRCMAKQVTGDWGGVASVGQECNNDPSVGPIALCENGLCFNGSDGLGIGFGCLTRCGSGLGAATADQEAMCDTTTETTGCDTSTNTCMGRPERACDTDIDCSSWECAEGLFSDIPASSRQCLPKSCDTNAGCGGGYYCDLGIDSTDNPDYEYGWVGSCGQQTEGGAAFGEPCDVNPTDEVILNNGDTCESTNLCQSGFCSALCETDADCGDDGRCTILEYIGDVDADDVDDIIEPGFVCEYAPQSATPCMAEADCADGETCNVFAAANLDDNSTTDAPYLFNGVCVTSPAGADAGYGNIVDFRGQCESGIGFELTDGSFACTEFCTMADQCDLDDGEGGTLEGICLPQLWSWGGDYDNTAVNIYAGLCLPAVLFGSSGDACGTDYACTEAGEACSPFTVASDPTAPPHTDFVCLDITDADGNMPTAALGDACSSDFDCASGLCTAESADETGYCTALCSDTVDSCGDTMSCVEYLVFERQGAFADNSGGYMRCEKTTE